MMKKYFLRVLLIISFLISNSAVFGQDNKLNHKQKEILWDADLSFEKGDFASTISSLTNLNSDNKNVNYLIGSSYYELKNYDSAFHYLEKGSTYNTNGYYKLAYISLNRGNFDGSIKWLKLFRDSKKNNSGLIPEFEVEQLGKSIDVAVSQLSNPEVVNIINLGKSINTKEDEYVPLISADEELLFFTSKRVEDNIELDPFGKPFENIYYAERKMNSSQWQIAKLVEGSVNTKKHDACVGLSPDGNTMYLFRTNKNLIGGDLYESTLKNNIWTTPIRMSKNINGFKSIEPSASITLDGSTLYFSSNREGGFGGFDLYQVKKLPTGEWSLPLNLGSNVNSPFDEDAPFIHPNGKDLYFSSKGFENMGGFDVFKSELVNGIFQKPKNLRAPTNSTKDDIFFTISPDEKHGYYSSNKSGGFGGQDIYKIDYLEKSLRQSVISAQVNLDGAPLSCTITLIEVETGELSGVFNSTPRNGKFIFLVNPAVEYELIIDGDGFDEYYEVIVFTTPELLEKRKKIINLKSIE